MGLLRFYFLSHYLFASLTAHTLALLPVMLAVGMGIITPYATGPGLVYYDSGYIRLADFWRLGAIFGILFLLALLLVGLPLLMAA